MSEQFTRGRKSQLSALTASTDLYVGVRIDAQGATWDVSCFCLDTADRLSDDNYFIFYNQPRSPDGAVQKIDPQAGDGDGFRVALDQVAATIGRLSFCAAL
ncbi:MAG: TerD family protein, partial [Micromonosporaceae bacterium]|nr:TerD family protein [Micromonosporaceae bacterium]